MSPCGKVLLLPCYLELRASSCQFLRRCWRDTPPGNGGGREKNYISTSGGVVAYYVLENLQNNAHDKAQRALKGFILKIVLNQFLPMTTTKKVRGMVLRRND